MKTSAKQMKHMKQSMVEAGGINLGEEVVPRTVQRMRLNRSSGQVAEASPVWERENGVKVSVPRDLHIE